MLCLGQQIMTKYVMTDTGVIVFPCTFQHCDFAHFNPTSAGFIKFVENEQNAGELSTVCYGGSVSLGLKSDPGDSARATRQLFN